MPLNTDRNRTPIKSKTRVSAFDSESLLDASKVDIFIIINTPFSYMFLYLFTKSAQTFGDKLVFPKTEIVPGALLKYIKPLICKQHTPLDWGP